MSHHSLPFSLTSLHYRDCIALPSIPFALSHASLHMYMHMLTFVLLICRGKWLYVVTRGYLKQPITQGAAVYLTVKLQAFGRLIQVYSQTIDVCGKNEDGEEGECPIESGNVTLTRDVAMPGRIPGGTYEVLIRAVNAKEEEREVLCVRMMLDL